MMLLLAAVLALGPGNHELRLSLGGLEREAIVLVPPGGGSGRPAWIVLHGGGGTAAGMDFHVSGSLSALSTREKVVMVFPQGIDKSWNDGRGSAIISAQTRKIDDVAFLAALIERVVKETGADPKRIYMAGISNGGMMTHRFACEKAGMLAAAGAVVTAMPMPTGASCAPARPVPVIMMNGSEDPLVAWDADYVRGPLGGFRGNRLTAPDTAALWAKLDGCAPEPAVSRQGPGVERRVWGHCKAGAEVALYRIEGGGHVWPGAHQYLPERVVGPATKDLDGTQTLWDFLKRYPRPSQ